MTIFSYTTTSATNRSNIIRGDVGFISGTWFAGSVGTANIATGGSTILAYGVTQRNGTAGVTTKPNFEIKTSLGAGSAKAGNIGFTHIQGTTSGKGATARPAFSGDWWAFTLV